MDGVLQKIAEAFVSRYSSLYGTFLLERRQSYGTHYVDINKSDRLARAQQGVSASVTTNREISGSGEGKGGSQRPGLTEKSSPNKEASTMRSASTLMFFTN